MQDLIQYPSLNWDTIAVTVVHCYPKLTQLHSKTCITFSKTYTCDIQVP